MRFRLTLLLMVVLAATAFAAPVSHGPAATGTYEIDCNRDAIWCQMPDDGAFVVASQQDVVYPFEAWTADDFMVDCGTVNEVQWWGGHWNYSAFLMPEYFVITFWADDNCIPGDILYQEMVYTYDATEIFADHYEYTAAITPFALDAGVTYWISIQAGLVFDPNGQWGWLPSIDADQGCDSVQLFPLLGTDVWTVHDNGDMAFCLYGDVITATEESSFSAVKSLY